MQVFDATEKVERFLTSVCSSAKEPLLPSKNSTTASLQYIMNL